MDGNWNKWWVVLLFILMLPKIVWVVLKDKLSKKRRF